MKKLLTLTIMLCSLIVSAQTTIQNDTLKFRLSTDEEYDLIKMSFDHAKGVNYTLLKKGALEEKKDAGTIYNIAVEVKKTEESNPMLYINKILKEGKDKYNFYEIGTSSNCSYAEYIVKDGETTMVIAAIFNGNLYVFEVTATNSMLTADQIILDFTQLRRSLNFTLGNSTE